MTSATIICKDYTVDELLELYSRFEFILYFSIQTSVIVALLAGTIVLRLILSRPDAWCQLYISSSTLGHQEEGEVVMEQEKQKVRQNSATSFLSTPSIPSSAPSIPSFTSTDFSLRGTNRIIRLMELKQMLAVCYAVTGGIIASQTVTLAKTRCNWRHVDFFSVALLTSDPRQFKSVLPNSIVGLLVVTSLMQVFWWNGA